MPFPDSASSYDGMDKVTQHSNRHYSNCDDDNGGMGKVGCSQRQPRWKIFDQTEKWNDENGKSGEREKEIEKASQQNNQR